MKKSLFAKTSILFLISAATSGCNQIAQVVTPTCSDDTTLTLVRKIISENIADANHQLSQEELKKRLTFNLVHATKLEENIRKYTCEATLIVSNGSDEYKKNLEYESQLDDADNHLVMIINLTNGDALAIKPIITASDSQHPSSTANHATVTTEETEQISSDTAGYLTEIETQIIGQPYSIARQRLLEIGFSADKQADTEIFYMAVDNDAAQCGNAGCSIPWRNQNLVFCVGVQVNDYLQQADWEVTSARSCE